MASDSINLATAIASGEWPPEATAWVRSGIKRYLRGDASLEVALQLTGANRTRARNIALLRAAAILNDGRNLSPWELAGLLQHAIRHYESSRARDHANPSPLDAALSDAVHSSARPIRSHRRLYELLRDD